jgi:hypothetical protein
MDALQAGITAAREGRRAEASALLRQALQANPRSEQGWLWLSAIVETDAERRTCLERVLAINPHNQTAQAGLEKLRGGNNSQPSYLPISRPAPLQSENITLTQMPAGPANSTTKPPSPHTMPTLGMSPLAPGARRIQRLEPQPVPVDGLNQLRATQFQPQPPPPAASPAQSGSWVALMLISGLSITALAGALMLGILWLIGWPPS